MNPEDIQALFERFESKDPSPSTELNFSSPYTLLVAVALSAQATDVSVNKVTQRLFSLAQTPPEMLKLGLERVTEEIRTIGLFRNKAKNVIALSQILVAQYDGEVPLQRAALESLPGVGRKTASVVLNELGVEPAVAVDTHVFRVAHRLGLAQGKTPDKVESELMRVIPERWIRRSHHWLILHGRYVCRARQPLCPGCLVRDLCGFKDKT